MREISLDELRTADGRDGRPAHIAYLGRVYDVSGSFLWQGGMHQTLHRAGCDLTAELARAPHGAEFVERFSLIGRLREPKGESTCAR